MSTKSAVQPFDIAAALLGAFATNDRINAYLIENLPEEAWKAPTPGGKGRTIPAIIGHMHNVRLMWLRSVGDATGLPDKLEEASFSKKDAIKALAASSRAVQDLIARSLAGDGRIKGFKPDACSFIGYLFAHDGHHRGQIAMMARQVGHPLSKSAGFGMWEWGTR
jgi:uncharacterized damage-inducible protein DinB